MISQLVQIAQNAMCSFQNISAMSASFTMTTLKSVSIIVSTAKSVELEKALELISITVMDAETAFQLSMLNVIHVQRIQ